MHPCTAIFFEFLDQCTLAPPFFPVFGLIPTPDTPFYQDFSLPLATKLEQQKMRNLVELQEIERTFRFRYPELYRRLCADGRPHPLSDFDRCGLNEEAVRRTLARLAAEGLVLLADDGTVRPAEEE